MYSRDYKGKTLGDLIDEAAATYGDREMVSFEGQSITFKEVHEKSVLLAKGLMRLGVERGDKVAIWMTNRPEWIYAEFAIAKAGATMVPLFTRLRPHEIEYILKQGDVAVLIMMDQFLGQNYVEMIRNICPELDEGGVPLESTRLPLLKQVICFSESGHEYPNMISFERIYELGSMVADNEVEDRQNRISPDDIFNIPFTAGTTGFPKGVMTSHEQYWRVILSMGDRWQAAPEDCFLGNSPFCFNLGNCAVLMAAMYGHRVVPMQLFDPGEAMRLIEKEKCSIMTGFATVYIMLLDHPDFGNYDTSSLRTGVLALAGVADPEKLIKRIIGELGMQNPISAYGMTENTGVTTMCCLNEPLENVAHTVGFPIPDIELKVVDVSTGKTLPPGEEGELCSKGFFLTKGYYKMPEESAKKMDDEGWFHTQDSAVIREDGYVSIKGRLGDMIKSGGINIYPSEIESFIAAHPKVKDVQVVGVPDKRRVEVPMAFVQLEPGESGTAEELVNYCRDRIADYKIPRYFQFVNEFPLSSLNKVQKFKLREQGIKEFGLETEIS